MNFRALWMGLLSAAMVAVVVSEPSAIAQEQAPPAVKASECWVPRFQCLTPPCCPKPLPPLPCWYYRSSCEHYCRKPLPCLTTPCIPYTCDTYQCKPIPCHIPKDPCDRCCK